MASIELTTCEIEVYRDALDADRNEVGPHIPNNVFYSMRRILKNRGFDAFPKQVTVREGFAGPVLELDFDLVSAPATYWSTDK